MISTFSDNAPDRPRQACNIRRRDAEALARDAQQAVSCDDGAVCSLVRGRDVAGNEAPGLHPVPGLIAARAASDSQPGARDDDCRLAVAIEGGSMRGTLTAGMALALHELVIGGAVVTAFSWQ